MTGTEFNCYTMQSSLGENICTFDFGERKRKPSGAAEIAGVVR